MSSEIIKNDIPKQIETVAWERANPTLGQIQNIHSVDEQIMEKLVLGGDLSQLTPVQKVTYYNAFCNKLGLNPLTKPFQIINFQGKQILYATKDSTEQLRKIHCVSITGLDKLFQEGLYIVTVTAQDKTGRQDAATGAVSISGLKGDALANAIMKAESKAKRRVTLSICGLGILDDSETDTIGEYKKIDITTGEVIENKELKREEKPIKISNQEVENISQEKEEEILNDINSTNNVKSLVSKYKEWSKFPLSKKFSEKLISICSARKYELLTNEDIKQ